MQCYAHTTLVQPCIYLDFLSSEGCSSLYTTILPRLDTASSFTVLEPSSSSLLGHRVCT